MDKTGTRKIFNDILRIHKNLRKSPEAYGILLLNLLILCMVIIVPSQRYLVIAAYFFETLAIGMFNVIKMLIITLFSPSRKNTGNFLPYLKKNPGTSSSSPLQTNFFLIVFFILHFSIFYFVQIGLLIGIAGDLDDNFPVNDSFFPNPFSFFASALGEQGIYTIYGILLIQLFSLIYGFLIKGEYKATNCVVQAIQPYGRIILQQLVVLIGGFFIVIIPNAAVFSALLVIAKTFLDVYAQRKHEDKVILRKA
jgi:hypothetical protein